MTSRGSECRAQLPAELWSAIFLDFTSRVPDIIDLATVCRQWRANIFSDPFLWTQVSLGNRQPELTMRQLDMQLRLSAGRVLQVVIIINDLAWQFVEQLITRVLAEHHRINSLNLTLESAETSLMQGQFELPVADIITPLIDGSIWPLLANLELKGGSYRSYEHTFVNFVAPRLSRLSVYHWHYVFPWKRLSGSTLRFVEAVEQDDTPFALPIYFNPLVEAFRARGRTAVFRRRTPVVWINLTSVSLEFVELTATDDLDRFLASCPALAHFALQLEEPPGADLHTLQCISSTLRRLEVSSKRQDGTGLSLKLFSEECLAILVHLHLKELFPAQPSFFIGTQLQVLDVYSVDVDLCDLAAVIASNRLGNLCSMRLHDIKRKNVDRDHERWSQVLGALTTPSTLLPSLKELELAFFGSAGGDTNLPHEDFTNFTAVVLAAFTNPDCRMRSASFWSFTLTPAHIESLFTGVNLEAQNTDVEMLDVIGDSIKLLHFSGKRASGTPFSAVAHVDLASIWQAMANGEDALISSMNDYPKIWKMLSLFEAQAAPGYETSWRT